MRKILLFTFLLGIFASCRQIEVGKMESFALKSFSGRSIFIDIKFEVNNPRALPVKINNAEFTLTAGDQSLGTAILQNPVKLAANKRDSYYFPLELKLSDNIGSYFSIMKILKKNTGPFVMKGWIDVRSGLVSKKLNFEKEIGKDEIPFP